jgi:hypothetical protein
VPENLAYALTQVIHNFGAVAIVGGSVFVLWPAPRVEYGRRFAWLILFGWGAQIASGALFGAVSLHFYGQMPDLNAIALTALIVKVTAAAAGFLLTAFYLARGRQWSRSGGKHTFQMLAALGIMALTAAAFLRWFS